MMKLIYFILNACLTTSLWGQFSSLPTDSIHGLDWTNNTGIYSTLFTGKEQLKYPVSMENDPSFIQKEPLMGFLSYDGVDYPYVGLRWDRYKDELIAISSDQRFNIILVPERLHEARFSGYHLRHLKKEEITGIPNSGYYLNLYENTFKVWEKPIAVLNEKHVDQRVVGYFSFLRRFYIQKGNTLYPVKSLSGVLKVFVDKRKELKLFAKQKKLNFGQAPEIVIPAIVKEYERLTQTEKQ